MFLSRMSKRSKLVRVEKLTLALALLVVSTLGLGLAQRSSSSQKTERTSDAARELQEKKQRFPTAQYNEPDLPDPQRNLLRKEKQVRRNDFKIVARNPQPWQAEGVVAGVPFDFPALPIGRSEVIVLGVVTNAEAHLSENKRNVYSEFAVSIESVLKTSVDSIIKGSELIVERIGGNVIYPNGQNLLYRISGHNMPVVGGRYLFFLTSKNKQDWSILTAYQLTEGGTTPLDDSAQFEELRGLSEESVLKRLRESLKLSSH
jgi:hypothetical protein